MSSNSLALAAGRKRAGSLGGVTEACFLQPMDVIKTRLQLDKAGKYTGACLQSLW